MSKNVDLTSKEWCDLVFVGKNKSFGAYTVRTNAPKRNTWAVLGVAAVLTLAIFLPDIIASFKPVEESSNFTGAAEMSDLEETEKEVEVEQVIIELPPPPPPVQEVQNSMKVTAPEMVSEDELDVENQVKSNDEVNKSDVAISNIDVTDGTDDKSAAIAEFEQTFEEPEPVEEKPVEVYTAVEQMPTFPGGDAELMKYLSANIKYPTIAQEQGIQGKVIVRFVVTDKGQIANVTIVRGVDPALDQEAIRVVQSMPAWTPGRQNGNAVYVWYTLPVTFKLM